MRTKRACLAMLALSVLVILSSCGGGGGGGLLVGAGVDNNDLNNTSAVIGITQGGNPVEDAVVTINGTVIDHWLFGIYMGTSLGIIAGDDVILDIQRGGTSISATVQMPAKPAITAPASGAQSEPVSVAWTWATTNPDLFAISVAGLYTPGGTIDDEYIGTELGSARGHSIPAGTFNTGLTTAYVTVGAVKHTTSMNGAEAGSEFEVSNTDQSPAFNPEP